MEREWNVSDIDRVTMFAKDCRYYNGGAVASKKEQQIWKKAEKKKKIEKENEFIFIDRLRE